MKRANKELIEAVITFDPVKAERAIEQGADVNMNINGIPLICYAITPGPLVRNDPVLFDSFITAFDSINYDNEIMQEMKSKLVEKLIQNGNKYGNLLDPGTGMDIFKRAREHGGAVKLIKSLEQKYIKDMVPPAKKIRTKSRL